MSNGRPDQTVALLAGLAKAIPAIALAILFGWMAYFVRSNGGREIDWFGPAFFAVLAGAGAIWTIMRAFTKPRGPKPGKASESEEPAFDADAALERYLSNRSDRPPASEAEPDMPAQRPVFGRKISP